MRANRRIAGASSRNRCCQLNESSRRGAIKATSRAMAALRSGLLKTDRPAHARQRVRAGREELGGTRRKKPRHVPGSRPEFGRFKLTELESPSRYITRRAPGI